MFGRNRLSRVPLSGVCNKQVDGADKERPIVVNNVPIKPCASFNKWRLPDGGLNLSNHRSMSLLHLGLTCNFACKAGEFGDTVLLAAFPCFRLLSAVACFYASHYCILQLRRQGKVRCHSCLQP